MWGCGRTSTPLPVSDRVMKPSSMSSIQKNIAMTTIAANTTSVILVVSSRVGQTTLRSSTREPCTYCASSRPCADSSATKMPAATATSTISQRTAAGYSSST